MDSTSVLVGVASYQMLRCRSVAAVLAEEVVAGQEKLQALVRVFEIVAEVAEYLVARSIFGSHSRFIYPNVVK